MTDMRTQMAAMLFQPVPGGYVYREPYRSPFGSAAHYLVDEAQKAQIIAITVPKRPILWQVGLWSALCAMVAIACVVMWAYTRHDNQTATDIAGMIVLTVAQTAIAFAVLRWWKLRRLRPLLATLRPTDLRITRTEMRTAAVNAMSVKQLVVTGASSVFASAAMLINAAIQLATHHAIGFFWLAISLVFAGVATYYFKRLIERAENRNPDGAQRNPG